MNWVAADLPARALVPELFATDGLLTGREARLAGPSFEENGWRGTRDPDRANNGLDPRDAAW
jgi:hypothetical protein